MELTKRSRCWVWTSFHETPPEFCSDWMSYMIWGREVCPTTGRPHFQGYLECKTRILGSALQSKPDWQGIHLEVRVKSQLAAINYCKKEDQVPPCEPNEEWAEWGEPMRQGQRSDLAGLATEILQGDVRVDDVLVENPHLIHQYGRTLLMLEDKYLRDHNRPAWAPPVVSWFYGASGAGKSRTAREEAAALAQGLYAHVFSDHGWWDLYQGETLVLLDDYRGGGRGRFAEFLRLTDGYQTAVPRRNRAPRPFMATHIWITSRKHPEDIGWDPDVKEHEDFTQLLRRITHLRYFP